MTFSWTDSNVSSDNSLTTCGALTWEVTQTDGFTAIDSSVFVEGDKTIDIQSDDILKASTYNIRVKVYYTDYSAVTQSLDFSILLQDYCDTNVVVTKPATISTQVYSIGGTQNDQTYGSFSWLPAYCVMST